MRGLRKWAGFALITVLFVLLAYLVYASWRVTGLLDTILRVGSPIAQGHDAPAAAGPSDIGYVGDPKAAFGYAVENLEIASDIGPMPAWLVPAGDTASSTWAIFVHGIGGRRENGYRFLPVLHEAGLPVLMLAYRNDEGAPPSPDGLYALGLTEWRDLDVAVGLARERGAKRIVLVAESMGGAIVGQFLRHSDKTGVISAMVLDAPMIDLAPTLSSLIGRLNVPLPSLVTRGSLWLAARRYPIDLSQAAVTDELAAYSGPMFLSHGAGDRIVPVATSDDLVKRRAAPTEYLRTEADHILSWKEDPARYEAALRGFLASLDEP